MFALVLPQLVFEEDQLANEKVREIGVLEHTAQVALQVSCCIYVSDLKFCSEFHIFLSSSERGYLNLVEEEI